MFNMEETDLKFERVEITKEHHYVTVMLYGATDTSTLDVKNYLVKYAGYKYGDLKLIYVSANEYFHRYVFHIEKKLFS